jgi:hypothetical protein
VRTSHRLCRAEHISSAQRYDFNDVNELWKWLEASAVGSTIAQSNWLFPAIETVHVIAFSIVVGSIAVLDLRLINMTWRQRAVTELKRDVLPWTWVSFAIAALTGTLMFTSAAEKYAANTAFRMKMGMLLMTAANMLIFHRFTYRTVLSWDHGVPPVRAARVAGVLSLIFWISVVTCGRWIGFTMKL